MNMGTPDPIANQGKILKSHGIERVNLSIFDLRFMLHWPFWYPKGLFLVSFSISVYYDANKWV